MDIKAKLQKVADLIKKNRYVVLILLAGVLLMCLPTGKKETTEDEELPPKQSEISVESKLGQILTQVEGAGEVQVFLTVASGEQTVYQTNDSLSRTENSEDTQTDTVTITDSKRNEAGLIKQVNPPLYLGAIVVCTGADNPVVKLEVIDAVSKATGLSSDKISVLKMK